MAGLSFSPLSLVAAFVADLLLGDPPTWPHPVRWIGRAVEEAEPFFYKDSSTPAIQRLRGALFWSFLVVGVAACVVLLLKAFSWVHEDLAILFGLWLAYTTLATRSLYEASKAVADALNAGRLDEARRHLSHIVSRNTEHLDEEGIWRALVETVSENFSDGILAPLFYLAFGGPVAAVLYKTVNTLDSMVGYKNDRYLHFGWWAARADDAWNWIPARLSALVLLAAGALCGLNWRRGWAVVWRDARKTASPNAGFPEAAVAGLLGVMLGGPAVYFGESVMKPTLGDALEPVSRKVYQRMMRLVFVGAMLGAVLATVVRFAMNT
ncbi:MAG: adenosylcobinamide-phosphate synthase CbiB [Desulfosoma sp.]|uniref:adenosylcobinamide-phosphate synthase CbiB n=1 Tax=Desulfosoma sp. TaxID=2603217 RepID=UPI0040494F0E